MGFRRKSARVLEIVTDVEGHPNIRFRRFAHVPTHTAKGPIRRGLRIPSRSENGAGITRRFSMQRGRDPQTRIQNEPRLRCQ